MFSQIYLYIFKRSSKVQEKFINALLRSLNCLGILGLDSTILRYIRNAKLAILQRFEDKFLILSWELESEAERIRGVTVQQGQQTRTGLFFTRKTLLLAMTNAKGKSWCCPTIESRDSASHSTGE